MKQSTPNIPECSLFHIRPILKISWKSVHLGFFSVIMLLTGKQTKKQTKEWRWKCSLRLLVEVITVLTSTVYWCIASKLKAPRNLYWMSNMFLWVEIFIFFVCYHVVPKRHSQLDYEFNGLQNKRKLKTTIWRCCFLKIFTVTMSLESFDQLA